MALRTFGVQLPCASLNSSSFSLAHLWSRHIGSFLSFFFFFNLPSELHSIMFFLPTFTWLTSSPPSSLCSDLNLQIKSSLTTHAQYSQSLLPHFISSVILFSCHKFNVYIFIAYYQFATSEYQLCNGNNLSSQFTAIPSHLKWWLACSRCSVTIC